MINKNELRIGNYISRKDLGSSEERIESVLEIYKDKLLTSGPLSVIVNYDEIQPIHLTKERLLNLGFTVRYFNEDKSKPLFWKVEGNRHIDIYFETAISSFAYIINRLQYSVAIFYVHQLQNLYFSLTGEELKLNE